MSQIVYETVPPTSLRPYARNARFHSRKQVNAIAASIREFGFTNPILVDEYGEIIAGHGRLQAAQELHLERVSVARISGLSEVQKRAPSRGQQAGFGLRLGSRTAEIGAGRSHAHRL